jgi:PAS domain S-box-containing protein
MSQYRAIVELDPDAVVVTDADGRIRLVNQQTEVLFGYARRELLGQPVELLLPERLRAVHQAHRQTYLAASRTRPMGANLRLLARRRDGSEFPVEIALSPLSSAEDGRASLVISNIRDVSEVLRVQAGWEAAEAARAAAETANAELRRLQAVTDSALSRLALEDLLHELLGRVFDLLGVDNAAILLVEESAEREGNQALVLRAAWGLEEPAVGARVPVHQGFAGRIAGTRAPLIVDDLSTFPVVNHFLRERLRSAVGVPLLLRERVLGVLHIGTAQPRHFTESDVQFLLHAAGRIALAIERAELYEAERVALASVRASEERLRLFVENVPAAVAMLDGELRYLSASRRWRQYYQFDDDYLGRHHYDLFPEVPDRWKEIHRRCLAGAVESSDEDRFERQDGSIQWLTWEVRPWYSQPGEVGGLLIFSEDLTERKRLQQEREEARARELAAREVARQLDQFFAMAAHDIRSPVTAVQGTVALAQSKATTLAEALEAHGGTEAGMAASVAARIALVQRSADALVRLTNLLFDVAQARAGTLKVQLAPCDLAALVREQVTVLQAVVPARTIHPEVPDEVVPVLGDALRLGEVLSNYVTNALKYSADEQPVVVRLEASCGQAVASVRDVGPGLTPEEQQRVWVQGYRAADVKAQSDIGKAGSLGLGLYICKQLIEEQQGQVGVESVVGQGSTFWFSLPLATPEPAQEGCAVGAPEG